MPELQTAVEAALRKVPVPVPEKNVIPPITDPMGKYWAQPSAANMLIDDTHALMTAHAFGYLSEYSTSKPSGVYPGKMWKRQQGKGGWPPQPDEKCTWYLAWFGYSEKPGYCSNNYRAILISDPENLPDNNEYNTLRGGKTKKQYLCQMKKKN